VAASGAAESAALALELVVRVVLLTDMDGRVFVAARRLGEDSSPQRVVLASGDATELRPASQTGWSSARRKPNAIVYCQTFGCR
jgi:hypothetical protein